LAAGSLAVGVEREGLGEDGVAFLQAGYQRGVVRGGRGKDDVEDLQAGAFGCQFVAERGQALAWPGPGPKLVQAGFVDVNEDDAAFRGRAGAGAPGPVAGALFKGVEGGGK